MKTRLVTVACSSSLESAYVLLKKFRIRHLPVVDNDGFVVGILSDRDLLRACVPIPLDDTVALSDLRFVSGASVMDYMSTDLKTIAAHGEIRDAIELMLGEKISSALVVAGDEVVGIITHDDLLEILKSYVEKPTGSLRSTITSVIASSPLGGISTLIANSGF